MASTSAPYGARRRAVQSWPRAVPGERKAPLKRGREGGRYKLDLAQTFVAAAFAAANDSHAQQPRAKPGAKIVGRAFARPFASTNGGLMDRTLKLTPLGLCPGSLGMSRSRPRRRPLQRIARERDWRERLRGRIRGRLAFPWQSPGPRLYGA